MGTIALLLKVAVGERPMLFESYMLPMLVCAYTFMSWPCLNVHDSNAPYLLAPLKRCAKQEQEKTAAVYNLAKHDVLIDIKSSDL
jgi:hypothetical protein